MSETSNKMLFIKTKHKTLLKTVLSSDFRPKQTLPPVI